MGFLFSVFLIGAFFLRGQHDGDSSVSIMEPYAMARMERGYTVYQTHCAGCHGTFLQGAEGWRANPGAPPALDGSGHADRHSDLDLVRVVSGGVRKPDGTVAMPAFRRTLEPDDIVSVLSYIAAWWPDAVLLARSGSDWTFPPDCVTPAPGTTTTAAGS